MTQTPLTPRGGERPQEELFRAAWLYYEEGATQAQVAADLEVSRPTVSRLLAEARRRGIVRISVVRPSSPPLGDLARALESHLGLERVYLGPGSQSEHIGTGLAAPAREAIQDMALQPGQILVLSSGQSVYQVVQTAGNDLSSVTVVPGVGGQSEPEPWHQTNEILRLAASELGAAPRFLFAQAMPSAGVYRALQEDPDFLGIRQLWERASACLVGVGAPTATRTSLASSVPHRHPSLHSAVGDICLHFYDTAGNLVEFPGSDRMISIGTDALRAIPRRVAVAAGVQKARSIVAGAGLGFFNRLVTDEETARAVLELPTTTDGAPQL
ncbi:sugar-binding transcriptional regulator [Kocuria sp.]|uniref:sugar-binding transcriptional regulator n=1 Tax=Kocuria sp. TaxID=1871328 RepID=UPI0026DD9B07|nr:sugar-binding domain-containing protein [Kocuria sp.]MDO4919364.1 sugar-binding domain-containing protein [Kocuria sp.]